MKNSKHIVAVAFLIVFSTVAMFALLKFMFQTPVVASTEARLIDNFIDIHFAMMAFLFSLIMVIVLYAGFVFRLKEDEDPEETYGTHVEGNTALEIAWTIIPTITVIIFGVYAITLLIQILAPEDNEMAVHVTGKQWSWSFNYPDLENRGNPQLVLPVNQPVLLEMEAEDVLHSFWVPEFRVKQDLVPGAMKVLRFTPTEIGEYKLRCAEICGLSHTDMVADVNIVSQADWVTFQQAVLDRPLFSELTPEERGAIWWAAGEGFSCNGCHTTDGAAGAGPTWLDIYGREEILADGSTIIVNDAYITESILDPDAKIVEGFGNAMPDEYEALFAQKEADILASEGIEVNILEDIMAFMKTLHEDVNTN